jgi:phosphoglycolate phosphatase
MTRAPIIVFDLDGTLADTAPDLTGALNRLLLREGLAAIGLASARPMVGRGARALIERGFAANGAPLGVARLDALEAAFLEDYEAHIAEETRLFPGAEAALDRFAGANYALAICTNKPEPLAKLLLQQLDVASRFAAICGHDTFSMCKPDGRALLLTIEAAGGDPARAVMVGDSRTDIDAAKNAGVPVAAVDFGYTETPVMELAPDAVISHFDELWQAATGLLQARLIANT